ncbi:MAG: hypothetical protein ACRDLT_11400 [Solirubrobacteraceae bacterium]
MHTRRLSRSVPALAVAGLTAVLVAACGGGSKPPSPSVSGHSSKDNGAQEAYRIGVRYSACMRTHGVTKFQDPRVHTQGNHVSVMIQVDPAITGSPAYKSAQKACGHLLPNAANGPSPARQRARTDAIVAFAKCMRQHGFPRFPDPTSQGQLTPEMLTKAGISLQQPAVKPAAYACLPLTHGILSRADVNQAIANPNGSGSQSGSGG